MDKNENLIESSVYNNLWIGEPAGVVGVEEGRLKYSWLPSELEMGENKWVMGVTLDNFIIISAKFSKEVF